jgi:hypothetical protein
MIQIFASQKLKQPIALFVPPGVLEEIKNLQDKNLINHKLLQLANAQIAQHGYEMGHCEYRNKQVTVRDCTACALSRGMKSKTEWGGCVKQHIRYNFDGGKKTFNVKIKNEKIAEKLKPTKTDAAKHHNQFVMKETLNERDIHDKNEIELIDKTRKNIEGEWDDSGK